MILQELKDFFVRHQLDENAHILLALSGGMDSMCLLKALQKGGYNFTAAHMNFGLRDEAKADEQFIRSYCSAHQIPFKAKSVNCERYAEQEGLSIQMAARKLRYQWFHQLMEKGDAIYLATAHHANDQIETILVNILKGYSPRMLAGMSACKLPLIKPMLSITKDQIRKFVEDERIPYREDKSNAETKYLRNKIRHELTPELRNIEPHFLKRLNEQCGYLNQMIDVFDEQVEAIDKKYCKHFNDIVRLDVVSLRDAVGGEALLFEFLKGYGLEPRQLKGLQQWEHREWPADGRKLETTSHRIYFYKPFMWIEPLKFDSRPKKITISTKEIIWNGSKIVLKPAVMEQQKLNEKKVFIPEALFEKGLELRSPQEGDVLKLKGMRGKKKLSDFLSEQKLPIPLRQRVPVLASGKEIHWVAGYRVCISLDLVEAGQKGYLAQLK